MEPNVNVIELLKKIVAVSKYNNSDMSLRFTRSGKSFLFTYLSSGLIRYLQIKEQEIVGKSVQQVLSHVRYESKLHDFCEAAMSGRELVAYFRPESCSHMFWIIKTNPLLYKGKVVEVQVYCLPFLHSEFQHATPQLPSFHTFDLPGE